MNKVFLSILIVFSFYQSKAQTDLLEQQSIFASPRIVEDIYEKNCDIVFEGVDQTTNRFTKELAKEHLFSFTPSDLKRQFANTYLLECEGQMRKLEDNIIVKFNIKINADKARGSYGLLENGAMIRLLLTDGSTVNCFNMKKNKGKIYKDKNYTLYRSYFQIEEKDYKILRKTEVERIGIVWSAGYELYDMYNMDYFKRQLNCLTQ